MIKYNKIFNYFNFHNIENIFKDPDFIKIESINFSYSNINNQCLEILFNN